MNCQSEAENIYTNHTMKLLNKAERILDVSDDIEALQRARILVCCRDLDIKQLQMLAAARTFNAELSKALDNFETATELEQGEKDANNENRTD